MLHFLFRSGVFRTIFKTCLHDILRFLNKPLFKNLSVKTFRIFAKKHNVSILKENILVTYLMYKERSINIEHLYPLPTPSYQNSSKNYQFQTNWTYRLKPADLKTKMNQVCIDFFLPSLLAKFARMPTASCFSSRVESFI